VSGAAPAANGRTEKLLLLWLRLFRDLHRQNWQRLRSPFKKRCLSRNGDTSVVKLSAKKLSLFEDTQPMTDWFARPVLHVTDVEASLRFYVNRLGFTSPWRYDQDGKVHVAQVDRQGCALILAGNWPEKIGKGLIFISLNLESEAQVAALDALRAELEAKDVAVKEGSWGYRLLVVDDPDGNQLFFNYPNEPASAKIAEDEA
jgi:catechol 2,3-dioxygenase-like lactoylglutathione lyase family enzyme